MAGWNPFDARETFDPGSIETALLAAGGRLILNPLQPASDARFYATPGVPAPPKLPTPVFAAAGMGPAAPASGPPKAVIIAAAAAGVVVLGLVAYKLKKRKKR